MKLIKASYEILSKIDREEILKDIEVAGRTCYKSEDKITKASASKFVTMISDKGHMSVIEHKSITVRFICDRGVSHEIVRHRLASFSQESTRYCNYSKDKFDNQLTFVIPSWLPDGDHLQRVENILYRNFENTEKDYLDMLKEGLPPQQARQVLPTGVKTELIMTGTDDDWNGFFELRCSPNAHPDARYLAEKARNLILSNNNS